MNLDFPETCNLTFEFKKACLVSTLICPFNALIMESPEKEKKKKKKKKEKEEDTF